MSNTTHTDFLGNTLNIGDEIAYFDRRDKRMQKAKIARLMPSKIEINSMLPYGSNKQIFPIDAIKINK